MPSVVHSTNRRQQVGYEGNQGGRFFHRAPLSSTQSTPSRQARASARGQPSLGLGLGALKRTLTIAHCSSLSCGRKNQKSGSTLDPAPGHDRSVIRGLLSETLTIPPSAVQLANRSSETGSIEVRGDRERAQKQVAAGGVQKSRPLPGCDSSAASLAVKQHPSSVIGVYLTTRLRLRAAPVSFAPTLPAQPSWRRRALDHRSAPGRADF